MDFLLDTNILSDLVRHAHGRIGAFRQFGKKLSREKHSAGGFHGRTNFTLATRCTDKKGRARPLEYQNLGIV
jgi:hypothetical protein